MERAELMFGADGTFPHTWHHYTEAEVEVPNQDRVVAVEMTPVRTAAAGGRGARDAGVIAAATGPGPSPQASADAGTRPDARTTGPAKALPTFGESPW